MPASWYDPADYHITLKFLGDVDEAEQPRLIEAALPVAMQTQPLLIKPAPFGGFPNMLTPSVLWAGVQISLEIDTLATRLGQAMVGLGFRADRRRYQPHITMARCHLETSIGSEWPMPTERLFVEFTASRFVLLKTRSGEGRANRVGLRYNTVHTFPFGNQTLSNVS